MHKLDRANVATPVCLAGYDHTVQVWDDVPAEHKQEIRASLEALQCSRCAYCESTLYGGSHIEHFRRKNRHHFPELTFSWGNLFLSCQAQLHCGHYKDRPSAPVYSPTDLVKPDEDEPDEILYFHSSGEVRARLGLNAVQQHRADETIRVFNLNCGVLQAARRRALAAYERNEPGILDALIDLDQPVREQFIMAEIAATSSDPYSTVIRHFFEKAH